MKNEEKEKLLRDYKDNYLKDVEKCVQTLAEMGDLRGDYGDILKWDDLKEEEGNTFDNAVKKYAESDNYDVLAALLTFLTREEVVDLGSFEDRAEKGDTEKIVDRMLTILSNGSSGLARDRMIKNN